jgi:hypothetical protein
MGELRQVNVMLKCRLTLPVIPRVLFWASFAVLAMSNLSAVSSLSLRHQVKSAYKKKVSDGGRPQQPVWTFTRDSASSGAVSVRTVALSKLAIDTSVATWMAGTN